VDDAVILFHRDLGGTGQPPLVILHGLLGSSRNWQTAGRELAGWTSPADAPTAKPAGEGSAERGFHVLALDLRNHGGSPHDEEMTYAAMKDDVIAWLDAQGLRRVTLMGHSLGGKTAMLLACRQPERVERLIVVDIAPKTYDSPEHRAEFAAMNELDLATLTSRAEAELRFERWVDDWGMRKFLATNLARTPDGGWRWTIALPVLTAALPELESNPLGPEDRFVGPVQIIVGGKSRYVAAADHAVIRRHFPAARIETIADSGHNPHMERRDEFVRMVRAGAARLS
jgi:pimeloyl-ACP methyl ester carboxylesterase